MTAKPWYHDPKARKILMMISLTGGFMLVELVFGIITGSLALISDAFHMLGDVIGLVIGALARKYSFQQRSHKMSYGFRRSEVLGAFTNGVFLLAISLFIVLDAISRFLEPPEIKDPITILIVGGIGLGINLAGLCLFHGHGGHGHSHGGHGHAHGSEQMTAEQQKTLQMQEDMLLEDVEAPQPSPSVQTAGSPAAVSHAENGGHGHAHAHSKRDLNLHAQFLHVLGDALGSVGVLISGFFLLYVEHEITLYIDSIVSVLIAIIIGWGSQRIVRETGRVLLQATPSHINLQQVASDIAQISNVVGLHELHCWSLSDSTAVASVHVQCLPGSNFMPIAHDIKQKLHDHHIHSVTIQPEYVPPERVGQSSEVCEVVCQLPCTADRCCPPSEAQEQHNQAVALAASQPPPPPTPAVVLG